MKTKIIKIKGSWEDVVDDCRASVGKGPLGHEPSEDFKKRIMINEHGPLRNIWIKWTWPGMKYWEAMHWKTHIWPALTNTQRNDRQDEYDRNKAPQDMPVDFRGDANPQHLIDTFRKRLCKKAAEETRNTAIDFKVTLRDIEPVISDALVPSCVYRCGCPEGDCDYYAKLLARDRKVGSHNIQERYDAYNRVFYEDLKCVN